MMSTGFTADRFGLCLFWLFVAPTFIHAQDAVELSGEDRWMEPDFEDVYSVGAQHGDAWQEFGSVVQVAFDEQSNLYVFDASGINDLRVLVFDQSGGFLREFGSAGRGPGEFSFPSAYAVMRDGTTIVGDMGHQGYQVFNESGVYIRTVRWAGTTATTGGNVQSGFAFLTAIQPDPRGGAVYTTQTWGMAVSPEVPARPDSFRVIARHSLYSAAAEPDTVVRAWHHSPGEWAGFDIAENPLAIAGSNTRATVFWSALSALARPPIFAPKLLMGLLPDGSIVYSDSSAYALKVAAPDSDRLVRIITRPLEPEPVTPRIREEYRRREGRSGASIRIRLVARAGSSPAPTGSQGLAIPVRETTFYSEIPVIQRLATTWEGRIWVMRQGHELTGDGPIDVVTSDGTYVGTYKAHATAIPDAFGPGGLAAFVELDEFDVASVVVRNLPRAVRQ